MIKIGRRQSERKCVMLSATLKLIDHDIPVRVVDLSSSGVKVVGANFRDGLQTLICAGTERNGEVASVGSVTVKPVFSSRKSMTLQNGVVQSRRPCHYASSIIVDLR